MDVAVKERTPGERQKALPADVSFLCIFFVNLDFSGQRGSSKFLQTSRIA